MRRLLAWVEGQSTERVLIACVVAVVLIGIADASTDPDYLLTIVYIIPISLSAWRAGWQRAWGITALAVVTLLIVDTLNPQDGALTPAVLWNQLSRLAVVVFIVILINGLREARQRAELMARTDILTGISNLFAFREVSARHLEHAQRNGQPLTLLFLDIDDFKIVNDFGGHSAGDEVLRRIARELSFAARQDDFVARVGGDEFVVLLPRTDAAQAADVINRITSRLATISRPDGSQLTCSLGMATHAPALATIDKIMQEADNAMYFMKAHRLPLEEQRVDPHGRSLRLLTSAEDNPVDASAFGTDS